jgi:Skp family chaperone for outer membrane proteins
MRFIIIFLSLLLYISVNGQNRGYINTDTTFKYLPGYQTAGKNLELMRTQIKDSMNIMTLKMDSTIYSYSGKKINDKVEIEDIEESIQEMQDDIMKYADDARERITRETKRVKASLKDELIMEMDSFAVYKKIKLLKDADEISDCEDCIDYTSQFIKYLKMKG